MTVAGYLLLDRGDPVGSLPSIVTSFAVATVAGEISS